jgi:hypothetical protein
MPDAEIPQPTSPQWSAWLSGLDSFAFLSRSGTHYTARREQRQRGAGYWYGYRSHRGKTIKRYIGLSTDLSLAPMEEVAAHVKSVYGVPTFFPGVFPAKQKREKMT